MLASELFALAHSCKSHGPFECYWCSGPCNNHLLHNEPPRQLFVKPSQPVKKMGNPFICIGCWLYHRQRTTVNFLTNGSFKDGQAISNYSWWLTQKGVIALRPMDYPFVYKLLLNPPLCFCLSLLDQSKVNFIQTVICNDHNVIQANTTLTWMLDNKPLTYTIYELQEAIDHGIKGKNGSISILLKILGTPPADVKSKSEKRSAGRPPTKEDGKETIRTVVKSGS